MWPPEIEGSATAEIDGQIAEIDENLERREISAIEQADLIARRVEMVEARRQVEAQSAQSAQAAQIEGSKRKDGKGHRQEGGISRTARDLGMPRDKVRRSLTIAGLAPEAKAKAADLGLASNKATLLAQMAEISENVDRRSLKTLDRAVLIRRYVELVKQHDELTAVQQVPQAAAPVEPSRKSHAGNRPGATKLAAEKFGVSRDTVQRALAAAKPNKAARPKAAPEVDHDLLRLRKGFDALAASMTGFRLRAAS